MTVLQPPSDTREPDDRLFYQRESDNHKTSRNHHYHVTLPARISLTLSCHPSLSSIAPGMSSVLNPVSIQRWCMLVQAGHPAFARPCDAVHRSISSTCSLLLLQQCPACVARLTLIFLWAFGGHITAVSWSSASRTYSILLTVTLCNRRLAFSP